MKHAKIRITALAGLTAIVLAASSLQAATIVWDFNDNNGVVDSNGLSGDGVTANSVAISSTGSVTADIGMSRAQRTLGSGSGRTGVFAFTLDIGATPIDLTNIAFDFGTDNDAGSVAQNHIRWDLAVTTTGSETPGLSETFGAYTVVGSRADTSFNESVAITGLSAVSNTSATFTFTLLFGANNTASPPNYNEGSNTSRWVFIDNVAITGEAIPEPSAALLGGLGVLALLRRRRS